MKRWITKPFLLLLIVLIGGEIIVRVFFARSMSGRFEYGYNQTSGFVESGDTVKLVRAGGRRFRPQSFSREIPAGGFRIMVIGDSVARGNSLENAYAYRVGEHLKKEGIKAETYNLAVPGYGARRNQIVLQQVIKYKPSLIIFHLNNSNEFEDERDWKRAQSFKSWHISNWPRKSMLLARLSEMKTEQFYWNWVPAEVRNRGMVSDVDDEFIANRDEAKVKGWNQLVAEKIAEDVAMVRAANIPMLIVTQARCIRSKDGSAEVIDRGGLEDMVRPLVGGNIATLSMKQVFTRPDAAQIFGDESHLKIEGHEILAKAIAKKLREADLLPTK